MARDPSDAQVNAVNSSSVGCRAYEEAQDRVLLTARGDRELTGRMEQHVVGVVSRRVLKSHKDLRWICPGDQLALRVHRSRAEAEIRESLVAEMHIDSVR